MLSTDDKRYMYYRNGQLAQVSSWKDGLLHGPVRKWSKMGILLDDLNYANDMLHGKQLRFSSLENVRKEEYYMCGIKHGLCRQWRNNKLIVAVIYINGSLALNVIDNDIVKIENLTPEHHTQLTILHGI
jgi:antitoxin component YwqK of YwqJK toxin-antitoxin module